MFKLVIVFMHCLFEVGLQGAWSEIVAAVVTQPQPPKLILLRSKPPSCFQVKRDRPSLCSSRAPRRVLAEELAISSVYLMYTPSNASDILQHKDVPTPHASCLFFS